MTGGSVLLYSLPHLYIARVLIQKGRVLQHLTLEYINECTEVRWILILKYIVKLSLWILKVYSICNKHSHQQVMEHWRMPVFPVPIFNVTILDVNGQFNQYISMYLDISDIIHSSLCPNITQVLPPPLILPWKWWHTCWVNLLCWCFTKSFTVNKCASYYKPYQWRPWLPLHHHFLLFVPLPQKILLSQ